MAEAGHVVDCLVGFGLGAVGVGDQVEDGESGFAVLHEADKVLASSDINAANDPVDEPLH